MWTGKYMVFIAAICTIWHYYFNMHEQVQYQCSQL